MVEKLRTEGPLVSVIIPTHNRRTLLPAAIDSVLLQTHEAVQVIVVDDGSTDGTTDAVAARYGDDGRVVYLYQDNTGVAGARNRGLEVVSGECVAFLDSDDRWEPWKLSLQLACMAALPEVGMVWSDMKAVDPDGRIIHPNFLRQMYYGYRRISTDELFSASFLLADLLPDFSGRVGSARVFWGDIYSQMVINNFVHTSTVLLRADWVRKIGGFDVELTRAGEDHDFHLRTCEIGPVGFIDFPTIEYRVGAADQLTEGESQIYMARNYLKTMRKALVANRHRIDLPQKSIDTAFSRAHGWLGESLFEDGRPKEARRHLARSLRLREGRGRRLACLLLSWCPSFVVRAARRVLPILRGITKDSTRDGVLDRR